MKKFKEFLENYDVYLDKPEGFKEPEETEPEEELTSDSQTQNKQANEVKL
jgi:hypothetical protein